LGARGAVAINPEGNIAHGGVIDASRFASVPDTLVATDHAAESIQAAQADISIPNAPGEAVQAKRLAPRRSGLRPARAQTDARLLP
jgi:hypothetical protein